MRFTVLLAVASIFRMDPATAQDRLLDRAWIPSDPPDGEVYAGSTLSPEEEEGDPVWVNADLGASDLGLAYDASINLMHGRYIYTVDAWGSSSKPLFEMFGPSPYKQFSSYNITLSRVISRDDIAAVVSVGAGLSLSSFTDHTAIPGTGGFLSGPDLKATTVRTIGLPLVFRLDVPSCSSVGFDMAMRGDLNPERTTFALVVGLRLGRIRCSEG